MTHSKARRVALVTGAGSGMGEATSRRFARDGLAVGVLDIDADAAYRVADSINREGGQAMALVADIADRAAVNTAVAHLREALGLVVVLVNNATVESFCSFMEIDDDGWDRVIISPARAGSSPSRGLAAEVSAKGITVNTVSPGFIDTPMARRAIEEGKFPVEVSSIYAAYPIPRLGKPDEVAAAVAFLASDEASYITAQLLGVNGGAAV